MTFNNVTSKMLKLSLIPCQLPFDSQDMTCFHRIFKVFILFYFTFCCITQQTPDFFFSV